MHQFRMATLRLPSCLALSGPRMTAYFTHKHGAVIHAGHPAGPDAFTPPNRRRTLAMPSRWRLYLSAIRTMFRLRSAHAPDCAVPVRRSMAALHVLALAEIHVQLHAHARSWGCSWRTRNNKAHAA